MTAYKDAAAGYGMEAYTEEALKILTEAWTTFAQAAAFAAYARYEGAELYAVVLGLIKDASAGMDAPDLEFVLGKLGDPLQTRIGQTLDFS